MACTCIRDTHLPKSSAGVNACAAVLLNHNVNRYPSFLFVPACAVSSCFSVCTCCAVLCLFQLLLVSCLPTHTFEVRSAFCSQVSKLVRTPLASQRLVANIQITRNRNMTPCYTMATAQASIQYQCWYLKALKFRRLDATLPLPASEK